MTDVDYEPITAEDELEFFCARYQLISWIATPFINKCYPDASSRGVCDHWKK